METKQINLCSGKPAGEKIDTNLLAVSEEWAKRISSSLDGLASFSKNDIDNYASLARTSFEAGVIRQRMDIYRYGCKDLCKFVGDWLRKNTPTYVPEVKELELETEIRDFGDNRSCVFFKTKNEKYYRLHSASQLACEHFERKEE